MNIPSIPPYRFSEQLDDMKQMEMVRLFAQQISNHSYFPDPGKKCRIPYNPLYDNLERLVSLRLQLSSAIHLFIRDESPMQTRTNNFGY